MISAIAYRVKYRKADQNGVPTKQMLSVGSLGVHPKNRGGVYPGGPRVKTLGTDVLASGFSKEEVNHACVAVEEVPIEEARSRGNDYVTGLAYNQNQCRGDQYLETCFNAPHDSVRHMMLSHNHIMLVARCFLTSANWDLTSEDQKGMKLCDNDGRLSLTAVGKYAKGKQLLEMVKEGIYVEVLSWKMDVEEPTAAGIISAALNKPQTFGMKNTELTAVAVLKGEIIVQMSMHVGELVAFQTVRDAVRAQLDGDADDIDFPEIFGFLMSLGVGQNSYVDDMLDFAGKFVDSTKRRLRFSAFGVVNAVCAECPWTKVALIKRAYSKDPRNGFCPNPETQWGNWPLNLMEPLEILLRFAHSTTCLRGLEGLPETQRSGLLGAIDVAAADAFYSAMTKVRPRDHVTKKQMVDATRRHFRTISEQLGDWQVEQQGLAIADWLDFTEDQQTAVAENPGTTAVTVTTFDEATGATQNAQASQPQPQPHGSTDPDTDRPSDVLPWRLWHKNSRHELGAREADKASAVTALHVLHESYDVTMQPIDVLLLSDGKTHNVVTNREVDQHDICLPPCVPKQSKVSEESDHPKAVKIEQQVLGPNIRLGIVGEVMRKNEFFITPEFQAPKKRDDAAVAGRHDDEAAVLRAASDFVVAAGSAGYDDAQWLWGEGRKETMHPFWAVTRLTQRQLALESAKSTNGLPLRFNCEEVKRQITNITMCTIRDQIHNITRMLEVPVLTNTIRLRAGEQLILEIPEPQAKAKAKAKAQNKRSWKQVVQAAEKCEQKESGKICRSKSSTSLV